MFVASSCVSAIYVDAKTLHNNEKQNKKSSVITDNKDSFNNQEYSYKEQKHNARGQQLRQNESGQEIKQYASKAHINTKTTIQNSNTDTDKQPLNNQDIQSRQAQKPKNNESNQYKLQYDRFNKLYIDIIHLSMVLMSNNTQEEQDEELLSQMTKKFIEINKDQLPSEIDLNQLASDKYKLMVAQDEYNKLDNNIVQARKYACEACIKILTKNLSDVNKIFTESKHGNLDEKINKAIYLFQKVVDVFSQCITIDHQIQMYDFMSNKSLNTDMKTIARSILDICIQKAKIEELKSEHFQVKYINDTLQNIVCKFELCMMFLFCDIQERQGIIADCIKNYKYKNNASLYDCMMDDNGIGLLLTNKDIIQSSMKHYNKIISDFVVIHDSAINDMEKTIRESIKNEYIKFDAYQFCKNIVSLNKVHEFYKKNGAYDNMSQQDINRRENTRELITIVTLLDLNDRILYINKKLNEANNKNSNGSDVWKLLSSNEYYDKYNYIDELNRIANFIESLKDIRCKDGYINSTIIRLHNDYVNTIELLQKLLGKMMNYCRSSVINKTTYQDLAQST